MDKHALARWLCGPETSPPSPSAIALALGLPARELADTTLLRTVVRVESLRFTLAVLSDAFVSDEDVRVWMDTVHEELGGQTARGAIMSGREDLVELAAIRTWNEICSIETAV